MVRRGHATARPSCEGCSENPTRWLFIAIVALLVFGPKRLPELGRSLGSGLRGFRDAMSGQDEPRAGGTQELAAGPDSTTEAQDQP
jgi:sec-independent protein translocase protein TatA